MAVVGLGYVGLVVAACFAHMGHRVVGIEAKREHLSALERNELPFYEPGLDELIAAQRASGRLSYVGNIPEGVVGVRVVFLAVGTPKGTVGAADLSQVEAAVIELAPAIADGTTVVIKSTVPIGSAARVGELIRAVRGPEFLLDVVSNPEFLQQGRAVESFLKPTRIVLGGDSPDAIDRVAMLYGGISAQVMRADHDAAAMIKYASNAFLATKISFANEMAKLCDAVGVDFLTVARGMGMDPRIGTSFLAPGPGFGGACLPKDVSALVALGQKEGVDMILFREVLRVNHRQPRYVFSKIRRLLGEVRGRVITLLGLSFKADTDDVRESPALDLARILLSEGAIVRAYDPLAESKSQRLVPAVDYRPGPYEAASGAHAAVICTEWAEFRALDLDRLRAALATPVLIDARNILQGEQALEHGFVYSGIGRGADLGV